MILIISAFFAASIPAQVAPPEENPSEPSGEVVTLAPFEVSTVRDEGYLATNTLSGTRMNTPLRDIAAPISVMTTDFLEDIAATSLEDAFLYSLNVENLDEFSSALANNGDMNQGVINDNRSRTRGLSQGTLSRNMFQTYLPVDSYNTERFTFSSGPGAVLFGLGSPTGVTDTTLKRARTNRISASVSFRIDSNDSFRTVLDLNVPLIKDRLAARAVYLNDEGKVFRHPAKNMSERTYTAVTYRPFKPTVIRASYENMTNDAFQARNTIVRDAVTPWIEAGRPLFDNSGIVNTGGSGPTNTRINAAGLQDVFVRHGNAIPHLTVNGGNEGAIQRWVNTVATRPPDTGLPGSDGARPGTLSDPSIFPWDVNTNGNGTRKFEDGWIANIVVEQSIYDKVFLEAAYNKERRYAWYIDMLPGVPVLEVDANMYLPDGVTPNPNVGRYMLTRVNSRSGYRHNEREDMRLTASTEVDLTQRSKWLGRHRFAALISREDGVDSSGYEHNLRVIDPSPELAAAGINSGQQLRVRAYVDDPQDPNNNGIFWVNMPFDPTQNTVLPDGTTIGSIHHPMGATNQNVGARLVRSLVDSSLLAIQNYWWDDRVVTFLGVRRDKLRDVNTQGPATPRMNTSELARFWRVNGWPDFDIEESGTTRNYGVVFHAHDWVSLNYSESKTFAPGSPGYQPDGVRIPGAHGAGRDFGFTLAPFGNKVYFRANFFENTAGPVFSAFFTNQIRTAVRRIDSAAVGAGAPPDPHYDDTPDDGRFIVTESTKSTGLEMELIANPLPNWRISVGAAKANTVQSDIGKAWLDFVERRTPIWAPFADVPLEEVPDRTIQRQYEILADTFNIMRQTEGAKNEGAREWRINATTRYSFRKGLLNGAFVGGSYRWRSKNAIGYAVNEIPNEFPFPGSPDFVLASDLSQPIYGKALTALDGFVGYSTKIFNDRIGWRLQLNIRNLFDDDTIIAQRAYSDGTTRFFTIPTPRTFILTSTFSY